MSTEFVEIRKFYPKKGEIYLAHVTEKDSVGCEMKKVRPVIIMSNDAYNYQRDTVRAIPLTSLKGKRTVDLCSQIIIQSSSTNGLSNDSIAVVEQSKPLSKQRLLKYLGMIDKEDINKLNKGILRVYDIDILYI